jgi:hypothetical protein
VVEDTSTKTAVLTLEFPSAASSPPGGGRAMFPKTVVDVYPLGEKRFLP